MKSPKIRFKKFNSEWNSTTLGELGEIVAGGDIDKNKILSKGIYPVYANALTNDGIVGYYNDYFRISAPAVTITGRGEVGYAQARFKNFTPVVRLLSLKTDSNVSFIACSINRKKIAVESTGVPQLTKPTLSNIKIQIPTDLKEQEAIGEFFRKIDEILDLEKLRFKKFENFKKTMLDKLFVAFGENTPRLRLGSFTSAWTSVNLGELGEIIKGQQINKIDLLPSGKYYVLNGGITPSGYTNSFNTNENIISISEGGNSCGFVNFNKEKFWSGGHNYTLQNLVINTRFLYALLKYREKNIMSLRVGSGLPNIQKSSLLEFKIQIPTDLKEQEAIGEFFKKIDEILELSQNRISKLENIKKYLLNKMFV
ncbi:MULTISPECIES: restriction endonuclease subunit S [Campylobacter]|uniref:restriction endonuclease subunit S n=1 Tax=Campylobacter TaxID=194 RepID=UPI000A32BFD9|nr:restriction endonuclease subunit S [Campylobacter sp. P0124]MCR8696855.1 restriction endonuclease subunit S [Campylobacter sp. RM19073]